MNERARPIRAMLRMKVKPGAEARFVDAWMRVAAVAAGVEGSIRQSLLRDQEDLQTFIVCTDWASRAAFGAFERSPEQHELTAPLRELRESASMTIFELVEHVESGVQLY